LSAKSSDKLEKEASIWQKLDHPNILRLIDVVQDSKSIYLISENCIGQDFQRYLQARKVFSEAEAAEIMLQIFGVINAGHKQGIIYRNIQPGNFLLLSMPASTGLVIKLVDIKDACFGSAKQQALMRTEPSDFTAPEIRKKTPYSSSCDMWSAGMIMLKLLSGSTASEPADVLSELGEQRSVSSKALGLMRQLLLNDSENRPLAAACVKHPWLSRSTHRLSVSLKDLAANAKHQKAPEGLKRAVLLFICTRVIGSSELRDAQKIFQALDEDGDGRLSKAELLKGIAQISFQPKSDVDSILSLLDADHNGTIEYTEFLMLFFSDSKVLTDKNLHLAFRSMDKDGSGSISVAELKEVLRVKEPSEEAWERYMSAIDATGDGTIDYEEFKAWVTQVTDS
jgi:calcium-dependent protein kinase